MKRALFAVVMALIFFVLTNFIYSNLDEATLGYKVVFKFEVPYFMSFKSIPLPLGFVLLITFSLGMVGLAVFEALPSLFKTLQLRAKNKRIRELEREISVLREIAERRQESGEIEGGEDQS